MQEHPDWFTGSAQTPVPATPASLLQRLMPFIIAASIVILLVAGGIVTYTTATRQACLTPSDYTRLTGLQYDGQLNPVANFYTTLITFQAGTATPSTTQQGGKAQLKSINDFYHTHKNSSVHLTVDSTYPHYDYFALTQQRAAAVKSALTDAGVPAEQITVTPPAYAPPVEPLVAGQQVTPPTAIALSITSSQSCR